MSLISRSNLFDFDRFFDTAPMRNLSKEIASPLVDIKEKDGHYEISAELPGIKKEDIHVHVHNGVLSIEAETSDENTEEKDGKVIRKERYSGKVMRSFTLGNNVNESDISANFEDGVLTLSVPKEAPEKPQARRIDIG
ncbi:MAG: Hsp20/alpha crystallin family protein [Pseudomonadales bacterium]|nr:Hsp20/alpha crystallin family protein [Pseudomonadales bacterium]